MPRVRKTYSGFWSDTEYLAIKGRSDNYMHSWRARIKTARVLDGLLEIENPEIVIDEIFEKSLKVAAKFAMLKGKEDVANEIFYIIERIRDYGTDVPNLPRSAP